MSYILDALKRADTERERGNVPGLHTRQLVTPSGQTVPSARSLLWQAVAAVVVLAGAGVGLWVWQMPAEAPPVVAQTPAIAPAQMAPPAATVALPPAVAAPVTPATALPVTPATVPAQPAPTRAAPELASLPKAKVKPEPIAPVVAAPAAATMAAVPLLGELPEDLRRQVPALTITGAVYSENPAQRLLLVNNLVLAQGALAAPELKLEEIHARSSVFSFRGTRFRVAH